MYSKKEYRLSIKTIFTSIYYLLHFPAFVKKVPFERAGFNLYVFIIFNCMRMSSHKTKTCSKQQTDMNWLVTDGLTSFLLHITFTGHAQRNKCSSNSLDLCLGIIYVISRGYARQNISITETLQTCFCVSFTRLVLNIHKVILLSL